jgi:hypothetical protein
MHASHALTKHIESLEEEEEEVRKKVIYVVCTPF